MAFDDLSLRARDLILELLEAHASGKYRREFYAAPAGGDGWSIRLKGISGNEDRELRGFNEGDLLRLEIEDEEARIIIERFFTAMSELPDVMQDRSPAEGYQWFKFGQLIYEIGTLAVVGSEDAKPVITSVIALESLTERMNLPTNLSQEVAKFIRTAKSKKSKNQVFEGANRIALAVYSMY